MYLLTLHDMNNLNEIVKRWRTAPLGSAYTRHRPIANDSGLFFKIEVRYNRGEPLFFVCCSDELVARRIQALLILEVVDIVNRINRGDNRFLSEVGGFDMVEMVVVSSDHIRIGRIDIPISEASLLADSMRELHLLPSTVPTDLI